MGRSIESAAKEEIETKGLTDTLPFTKQEFELVAKKNGWVLNALVKEGIKFINSAQHLSAFVAIATDPTGRVWASISLMGERKAPTWGQVRQAKRLFFGEIRTVVVLPDSELEVGLVQSINLFSCLSEEHIPGFTPMIKIANAAHQTKF